MECTRRHFFRQGGLEFANALASGLRRSNGPSAAPPVLRPPGALPEPEFLARCTRCAACVDACPKGTLRMGGDEPSPRAAGAPWLAPRSTPCWACRDLPCIAACEPGALVPAESFAFRIGRLQLDRDRCYAAQGSICETCAERCPVRPRPIRVAFGSAPEINHDRCTGCGVCVFLCPAGALDVVPHDVEPRTARRESPREP